MQPNYNIEKDQASFILGEIYLQIIAWTGPFEQATTSETEPLAGIVTEVVSEEVRNETEPQSS